MKKERIGVFETNSSSTHSICIAKNAKLIIPSEIHFAFGEFGWEFRKLKSLADKASYLYTGLMNNRMETEFQQVKELLESKGIPVTYEERIVEHKCYHDQKGHFIQYESSPNEGYVDHSIDLVPFLNAVLSDEESLMNFLFSGMSYIRTGNDNDDRSVKINETYPHDVYYKGN